MLAAFAFAGMALAGCSATPSVPATGADAGGLEPHVVIGIADTGINPYHELFYRPNLTAHPCTYIRDMPCTLRELRLHVGMQDWDAAFELDRAAWESLEPDVWYWIPQTVFIAVACNSPSSDPLAYVFDTCVIDQADHGSATTSIATMNNPDAFIAFSQGDRIAPFRDAGIPVDVYSVSWALRAPMPVPRAALPCPYGDGAPLYVVPAGNDVNTVPADCQSGRPDVIVVGGGYTSPYGHDSSSGNLFDVESYFCPPYAPSNAATGLMEPGSWCGTSWGAPTVAASLSKVILRLRWESGYTGTITPDGVVDPILGVTAAQLRDAMNRTATYAPPAKYPVPNTSAGPTGGGSGVAIPVNPAAPWLQWGWGFYDADIANATIEFLTGHPVDEKPPAAREYMAAMYDLRSTLYNEP